jgi:catechol 2,3-dioxygenase-like lactoylglutathione lyase family enzyme
MNPIKNEIGTVFIPVSDLERARDWYCDIFGLEADREISHGLYVIPMVGSGIVLDRNRYAPEQLCKVSPLHLNTNNFHEAYEYMISNGVEVTTGTEQNRLFEFKDLDGNVLMVCQC